MPPPVRNCSPACGKAWRPCRKSRQEACCLRFLEDLSYGEIAEELKITVNHVGVLLNRAKVALREISWPLPRRPEFKMIPQNESEDYDD